MQLGRRVKTAPTVGNVGEILKRLRLRKGVSLSEVGEATGLSSSFLSAVERGKSDIALGRLARIAEYFDHDVGSLLGYTERRARPLFVGDENRLQVARGAGVRYEVYRVPGTSIEVMVSELEPGARYDDDLTHEGVDIVLPVRGAVVAEIAGTNHVIRERQCAVWAGSYHHRLSNPFRQPATVVGVVTENVF